ncbi:MOSC domain-containing protein [Actinomadura soli]|nr:MOSC domain-containing protein [Actinomadura soli]
MLLSVNIGKPRTNQWNKSATTGIDKRPVDGPIMVTAPEPAAPGAVGLAGDRTFSSGHGGPDQAVYAYAREDLDVWQNELGRTLPDGVFGENLTTTGIDVNGALIGERWRLGSEVVLEVSRPRIPCRTFQGWLDEEGWIKRFTRTARPGTYLRVIEPGAIRPGDPIELVHRPQHDVTVAIAFRALTGESDLLPRLLPLEALPEELRDKARRRIA